MLDTVPNGFSLGLFWAFGTRDISSLLSVAVECSLDRLGGGTGAVWDSATSDETGNEDGDEGDGDDEVKMEDNAFSGPDFLRPLLFWNDDQFIHKLMMYI